MWHRVNAGNSRVNVGNRRVNVGNCGMNVGNCRVHVGNCQLSGECWQLSCTVQHRARRSGGQVVRRSGGQAVRWSGGQGHRGQLHVHSPSSVTRCPGPVSSCSPCGTQNCDAASARKLRKHTQTTHTQSLHKRVPCRTVFLRGEKKESCFSLDAAASGLNHNGNILLHS